MERSFSLHLQLLEAYRDNDYIIELVGLDITNELKEKKSHFPHIQKITSLNNFRKIAQKKFKDEPS